MYILLSNTNWKKLDINITRDEHFLDLAYHISTRSKCKRASYGSVIVSGNTHRIISTGYNGKPRNSINDDHCYRVGLPDNDPGPLCCIHSEMNALLYSNPSDRIGGTIYVSGIPCKNCMLHILQSGLSEVVYYIDPHSIHRGSSDLEFIHEYGIDIAVRIYLRAYTARVSYDLKKYLKPKTQILGVPDHARGSTQHPDIEPGFITSISDNGGVFARFWHKSTLYDMNTTLELRTKSNSEQLDLDHIAIVPSVPQDIVDRFFTGDDFTYSGD